MKIIEKFEDLDKANAYVANINQAFTVSSAEKKSESDRATLLQKSLDEKDKSASQLKLQNDKIIADLTTERDGALEEVKSLAKKIDLQEKHGADGTIVSIGSKNYKLSGNRFITKDGEKSAEQVSQDKEFLKHLVTIGSGVLTLID